MVEKESLEKMEKGIKYVRVPMQEYYKMKDQLAVPGKRSARAKGR